MLQKMISFDPPKNGETLAVNERSIVDVLVSAGSGSTIIDITVSYTFSLLCRPPYMSVYTCVCLCMRVSKLQRWCHRGRLSTDKRLHGQGVSAISQALVGFIPFDSG